MKCSFLSMRIYIITLLFISLSFSLILTIPQNNPYDPEVVYTVFLSDKFYTKKKGAGISLNLSPFYLHSSGARDKGGKKVPEGDMYGQWSMIPILFNNKTTNPENYSVFIPSGKTLQFNQGDAFTGGAPVSSTEDHGNYPYFSRAHRVLDGQKEGKDKATVGWTSRKIEIPNPKWGRDISKDYTDPKEFDTQDNTTGFFSIKTDYEKMGVRGQIHFSYENKIGLKIKSGIVNYKQVPHFTDQTVTDTIAKTYVKEYLMDEDSRNNITNEVLWGIDEQKDTTMEDTNIELYVNIPFDLKDDEDVHVATLIPHLSIGGWLPSGTKKDQRHAFSVPTGNDGFAGFTVNGTVNVDFPGMMQLCFGVGGIFYGSKEYSEYRVPNSQYQQGIFPWLAKVKRQPGEIWYANASMKARFFSDHFSFYFDYIHSEHLKDKFTFKDTTEKNDLLYKKTLEENSMWKNNLVQGGINYTISPGLELGLGFQAHISGVRVYKTTTILGTLTFNY
ncbi:hypothetical protein GF322_03255 [Candidatus Dependentiae bacterium]|nr:hypothetical protein [Candidatus Dependentiae bacterium]